MRPRFHIIALALAVSVAVPAAQTPAASQRQTAPVASDTLRLPFETITLPNGLTVILSPDKTTPTVSVNVWYKVGSKNGWGERASRICSSTSCSPVPEMCRTVSTTS